MTEQQQQQQDAYTCISKTTFEYFFHFGQNTPTTLILSVEL